MKNTIVAHNPLYLARESLGLSIVTELSSLAGTDLPCASPRRPWARCLRCPVMCRCASRFRHYHPCFFWFSFPFLVCKAFEIHIAVTCCPVFQAALNGCQGLLPEELMTKSLSFQPLARLEIHLGMGVGSKGPAILNPSEKPQ